MGECRSTSESKQSVFPGFSTRIIRAETTKDLEYFNVSNSKNLYFVENHVS